jgi:hypothetical protein
MDTNGFHDWLLLWRESSRLAIVPQTGQGPKHLKNTYLRREDRHARLVKLLRIFCYVYVFYLIALHLCGSPLRFASGLRA